MTPCHGVGMRVIHSLCVFLGMAISQDGFGQMRLQGPGGEAITNATIYEVLESPRPDNQGKSTYRTVKHSFSPDLKWVGQTHWRHNRFIVIDALGYALGVHRNSRGPCQLQKDFAVEGLVHDAAGKPVEGAEISIGQVGLQTYDSVCLSQPGIVLPACTTTTDAKGGYRLRGMVFNDHGFDVQAEVLARKHAGDDLMLGATAQSFLGPQAFFDEGRKARAAREKKYGPRGSLILAPARKISGVLRDAVTGEMLANRAIYADGLLPDPASGTRRQFTDEQGRFEFGPMVIDTLSIDGGRSHQGCELSPEKQNHGLTLVVPLRPILPVSGRVFDSRSGQPPTLPPRISFEFSESLEEGWKMVTRGKCTGEDGRVVSREVDGGFRGRLPAGRFTIDVESTAPLTKDTVGARYSVSHTVELRPGETEHLLLDIAP